MSYDISFKVKAEGCNNFVPIEPELFNYTYNLAPAWCAASGQKDFSLRHLNGKTAAEGLDVLRRIVKELTEHKEKYIQYEPANKWGSIDSSIPFLQGIIDIWEKYPTAILEVD